MPNRPREQDSTEKNWYYLLDDETHGPVPGTQMRRLVQSGVLGQDTLVWCQGMKDWVPVHALKAAAAARRESAPPPLPQTAALSSAPVRVAGRPYPALHSVSDDGPSERPRRSTLPWVVAGALAALVILMCGIGLGYLLRGPADKSARATPSAEPAAAQPPHVARGASPSGGPPAPPPFVSHADAAPRAPSKSAAGSNRPATPILVSPSRDNQATGPTRDEPSKSTGPDAAAESAAPGEPQRESSVPPPTTLADGTTTLYQLIDIQRRPSSGIEGMMMSQELRYQILTRLELGPRQTDKTRQVTQKVEQVRMGAADALSRATYEASLNKLVGQQYAFTLNERDEITEFKGFEAPTNNAAISPPDQAGFLMATVIDQDGWKELMQRSFLRPPDTANQVWRGAVQHSWGPLGSWRGITTYTPRGPEGYGIRYEFAHEMSYVPPEPSAGVLPFDVAGAEFQPVQANGSFVFDAQHGHVISVQEVFHVRGAVAAGLMGTTTRLQIEEYQEFTIQISSENPWQPSTNNG